MVGLHPILNPSKKIKFLITTDIKIFLGALLILTRLIEQGITLNYKGEESEVSKECST